MYFSNFPTIAYKQDGYNKQACNILLAVLPSRLEVDKSYIFQRYIVADGERPESVANKLYKNADFYWTILVINNIVNPFTDWVMSDDELEKYVLGKYGEPNGVHHFFDLNRSKICDEVDDRHYRKLMEDGIQVPHNIMIITNRDYERTINDEHRSVLVINPRYITKFIEAYNKEIEDRDV